MDYRGQALAERVSTLLLTCAATAALVTGYALHDFGLMMRAYAAAVALAAAQWPPRRPAPSLRPTSGCFSGFDF